MKSSYSYCNNCAKQGHSYNACKSPITSMGIIAFRKGTSGIELLMIRRKDTLGFVEFVRGKYNIHNKGYIQNIVNIMTIEEKRRIVNDDFHDLWSSVWGNHTNSKYNEEESNSKYKLEEIRRGISSYTRSFSLKDLVSESSTTWEEPEWGFPKGRRNYQEKDYECALREFEEETGYSEKSIKLIENILPFEEIFMGSNYKCYKHQYFLAYIDKEEAIPNTYMKSEVSKIEWKTFDQCIASVRDYNVEKIDMIKQIEQVLRHSKFCS